MSTLENGFKHSMCHYLSTTNQDVNQAFDVPMISYNESKLSFYKEDFKWHKKLNTKHILPTNVRCDL